MVYISAYIWIYLCITNTTEPSGCRFFGVVLLIHNKQAILSILTNNNLYFPSCARSHFVKICTRKLHKCVHMANVEFNLPLRRCCDSLYQLPAILLHNRSSMRDNWIKAPWTRREKNTPKQATLILFGGQSNCPHSPRCALYPIAGQCDITCNEIITWKLRPELQM